MCPSHMLWFLINKEWMNYVLRWITMEMLNFICKVMCRLITVSWIYYLVPNKPLSLIGVYFLRYLLWKWLFHMLLTIVTLIYFLYVIWWFLWWILELLESDDLSCATIVFLAWKLDIEVDMQEVLIRSKKMGLFSLISLVRCHVVEELGTCVNNKVSLPLIN